MTIKKITAIVRNDVLERVEQKLQAVRPPGITVSTVKGYGEYANFFEHDWLVRHARIEIFAPDEQVDEIVEAIRDGARTGGPGDGFVAVLPVERMFKTRESPVPQGQHAEPIIAHTTRRPDRASAALAQLMVVLAVLAVFTAYLVPAIHRFHFLACSILLLVVAGVLISRPRRMSQ